MPGAARYRLRQFGAALVARVRPAERRWVVGVLRPAELRLFERMPRYDQRHALDVCLALRRDGRHDPDIWCAALLHDCGKCDDRGRPMPLVWYGVFVILQACWPAAYRAAARSGRAAWRWFGIHAAHEQRAVRLAQQAGARPEVLAILAAIASGAPHPGADAVRHADARH